MRLDGVDLGIDDLKVGLNILFISEYQNLQLLENEEHNSDIGSRGSALWFNISSSFTTN